LHRFRGARERDIQPRNAGESVDAVRAGILADENIGEA
jgi:hypothetical protein